MVKIELLKLDDIKTSDRSGNLKLFLTEISILLKNSSTEQFILIIRLPASLI